MKKHQKIEEIMPGCKIAKTTAGEMMFGCPSEIIKALLRKNRKIPRILISPSDFYKFGVFQAAFEFPLENFLFKEQGFFKGEKLIIAGSSNQVNRVRTILRLKILGPSKEEMKKWKIPVKERQMLTKVQNELALKNPDGKLATIDDMVQFIEFIDNVAKIDKVQIETIDDNVFKITDHGEEFFLDINLAEEQKPPVPIEIPKELAKRSVLEATTLSKMTTGFDPTGYTLGFVLFLNGLGVSVDSVAWMKEHLVTRGINPQNEINAHILTHIHDDHSNILDLIVNGKKATLITTKVTYQSFLVIASCILDLLIEKIQQMVKFVKVTPGKKLQWYGAEFDFWYTVHSIPTIGFRVTINNKSIVYSGDTMWGSRLDELKAKGVIDADYYQTVSNIPNLHSELTFFDAGGGMIHPHIEELALLPEQVRKRIVPIHIDSIPEAFNDQFALKRTVTPGQIWEIIPQKKWNTDDLLALMGSPLLQGIDRHWISVIISQGRVKDHSARKVLLEEGRPGKDFYLLLGGTVKVLYGDEEITELSTGDFFGEISIMQGVPCTATIITKSPAKVLEIPKEVFLEMTKSTGLAKKLERIHQVRPILIKFAFLKSLEPENINQLIGKVKMKKFKKGEIIIRQGEMGEHFYGIIDGKVNIVVGINNRAKNIATLYRNQYFGEISLLGNDKCTADVVAATDIEVFSLSKKQFDKLIREIPGLYYQLGIMATQRKGNLLQKIQK